MKKIHSAIIALALLLGSCGESMFDTYKDFAGDGEIRYVGMVKDLTVSPGWQHINVSWENPSDPIVDQMEVKWIDEDGRDSTFLPAGTSTYDIKNLTTGSNYEVIVVGVDKNGNESKAVSQYVRPYNENHEAVQSFTRVISRSFFLHNHLLMTFLGADSQVDDAYLEYTKQSNGQQGHFSLTDDVVNSLHYDLADVDATKPVTLHRVGRIAGCPDVINFPLVTLETDRVFSTEYKTELKRQFGFDELIPDNWANSLSTLDLDWNIGDFADLLYFPNLKTLNLGKNRYVRQDQVDDAEKAQSQVVDAELSDWVLEKLHELNGLKVYRYDKHFSTLAKKSFINDEGHHNAPAYNYVNMKNATITQSPDEGDDLAQQGWSSHTENLVDGNLETNWSPWPRSANTTFTVTIELPQAQQAKGLRLVQSYFGDALATERLTAPSMVEVYTSEDGVIFNLATFEEQTTIGSSTGEINFIPFSETKNVKAVRINVNTPQYYKQYKISLAEATLYK